MKHIQKIFHWGTNAEEKKTPVKASVTSDSSLLRVQREHKWKNLMPVFVFAL